MSGKKKTCPVNWDVVAHAYIDEVREVSAAGSIQIDGDVNIGREPNDNEWKHEQRIIGASARVLVTLDLPPVPPGLFLFGDGALWPVANAPGEDAGNIVTDGLADDLPEALQSAIHETVYAHGVWTGLDAPLKWSFVSRGCIVIRTLTPMVYLVVDLEGEAAP